jgi:hypothetical protein
LVGTGAESPEAREAFLAARVSSNAVFFSSSEAPISLIFFSISSLAAKNFFSSGAYRI